MPRASSVCVPRPLSLLAERSHHVVAEWLDQVGQRRSVTGFEEHLNGHAGNKELLAEAPVFVGNCNGRQIEGLVAGRIEDRRGADNVDPALNLRRGTLVEGRKAQFNL